MHPAPEQRVLGILSIDESNEIGSLLGLDALEQTLSRTLSLPPRAFVFIFHVSDKEASVASQSLQKGRGVAPKFIGGRSSSFTPR